MKNKRIIPGIIFFCFALIFLLSTHLFAKGNKKSILAVFSNQERPAPQFDHFSHEKAVACDKCHHILDTKINQLVYSEGEEADCIDGHTTKHEGNSLAIRDANHFSCTSCHRSLKKEKNPAGPTTCGECHKK